MDEHKSAETLYLEMQGERSTWLNEARANAALVQPKLYREGDDLTNHGQYQYVNEPNQSAGELLFDGLVNTVVAAAWPAIGGSFRLDYDPIELLKASAEAGLSEEETQDSLEQAFTIRERAVAFQINKLGLRSFLKWDLAHIIAGGQSLLYVPLDPKDNEVKIYGIDRHACRRDGSHMPYEWVAVDVYAFASLEQATKEHALENGFKEDSKDIRVYTHGYLDDKKRWVVYQEVGGAEVPNTRKVYKKDEPCEWMIAGSDGVYNEHYRRAYVSKYYRDLLAMDSCAAAINQKTGLVRLFDKAYLGSGRRTPPLAVFNQGPTVRANADSVSFLQDSGSNTYQLFSDRMETLRRDLSQAFLNTPGLVRDAERVTAAEIEMLQRRVEMSSFSGFYPFYQQERMVPLISLLNKRVERAAGKFLAPLPPEVSPVITTGLEALSRQRRADNLLVTMEQLITASQGNASPFMEYHPISVEVFRNHGHDAKRFVKTTEEIQEEEAKAALVQAGTQFLSEQASASLAPPQPQ